MSGGLIKDTKEGAAPVVARVANKAGGVVKSYAARAQGKGKVQCPPALRATVSKGPASKRCLKKKKSYY